MAGDVPTSLCIPIIRDSQSTYPRFKEAKKTIVLESLGQLRRLELKDIRHSGMLVAGIQLEFESSSRTRSGSSFQPKT